MRSFRLGTLLIACFLCVAPVLTHATSTEDLQRQIDDNNAQIDQLNKEIAQYEAQLKTTTTQKNTLQNKINQLDLQRKKLQTSIVVTQKQINTTQAQISELSNTITVTQSSIDKNLDGLGQSIRALALADSVPLAAQVLSSGSVSDAWREIDAEAQIQDAVRQNIDELSGKKQMLSNTKSQAEVRNQQLVTQQKDLTTKQGSLNATRQTQAQLLAQTKSQESAYQQLIAKKRAEEQNFEDTLRALQEKLKAANTSTAAAPGAGVLSWPLNSVRITQYFGNTEFARTAAYKGNGHNGIDLAAAIGTPVMAALDGTVDATNFGSAPNCQYGKWVLVRHNDGLSTLYAHLSSISVAPGQSVSTGDILGYSGETGYATGPHLHFTVYVSTAVSYVNYRCASGPTVRIPISPFNGYLNPMLYLPNL